MSGPLQQRSGSTQSQYVNSSLFPTTSEFTVDTLMANQNTGWRETVEWLYANHYKRLHCRAYAGLHDKSRVPELVQEVFVRLLKEDRELQKNDEAEKYLNTVFRNLLIDFIRKGQRWQKVAIEDTPPEEISREAEQEDAIVSNRMDGKSIPLPEGERSIFEMAYFQKLSDGQISERLGLSLNVIRYSLVRSRRSLENLLLMKHSYTKAELKQFFSRKKRE